MSTEITAISIVDSAMTQVGAQPPSRAEGRRTPKGAVYRIRPDGLWDVVWESSDDAPYDLSFESGGALLVGTGGTGKIYRVAGDPAKTTLLARAQAQQVTRFLRDEAGRHLFVTANPGKIFRLSEERAARGTYDSDVRDARTVATWGTIRWRGSAIGSDLQLFTRSGNTATPDETWSDWAGPYRSADGDQIKSPNARYLQWRAVLIGATGRGRDASPILTSVTAAYMPRNLRPEVSGITVHPAGVVFQRPFSTGELEIAGYEDTSADGRQQNAGPQPAGQTQASQAPALGRRIYQKGLQTFVWKAEDPNDDRMQFDVLYRREGETTWKALKRGAWDPIFVWDTTSVPDGSYFMKIVASDAPSNSPGAALSGELESISFDIDNTPPRIEVGNVRRTSGRAAIAFSVRDDQSAIQRVEYSLEADRWRVVYPKDGIPDSRTEEFEITLDEAQATRSVIIRAIDAMNNTTTAVAEAGKSSR